ncbi:MAG: polysaccharide pyruvyl transferase family protein [Firmicutes bacterium]|nr:polysaccharide pyruvyl transferase family protein [Bacillota bacterium]
MRKQILICQHGGSANHGCEALARTVIQQIRQIDGDCRIVLYSYNTPEDKKYLADIPDLTICGLRRLPGKYSPTNIAYHVKQAVKPGQASKVPITKELRQMIAGADLVIAIGGDNYCYNKGRGYFGLDRYIKSQGKNYVLLGSSIEPKDLLGELARHLRLFDYISAREPFTYQALLDHGLENCRYAPDSAFLLPADQPVLPAGFQPEQAVGINISPLILKKESSLGITMENCRTLIRYILDKTPWQVALIPHVTQKGNDDRDVLRLLHIAFGEEERVFVIEDQNACQLKGLISRLRFLVAARTHASIAAYSSAVPTLVLGYSIKAKGIAADLFGDYREWVLPVQSFREENQLTAAFQNLVAKEEWVKERYAQVLEPYKEKAREAFAPLRLLLQGEDLPAPEPRRRLTPVALCCGCGLCAEVCPQQCIHMSNNPEGFAYPRIDEEKCTDCGLCAEMCPVNAKLRNHTEPAPSFAAAALDPALLPVSSSGGMFSLLAEEILNRGGVVAGAAWDHSFQVRHMMVDWQEELFLLRGSKYVQSDISRCYKGIAEALENQRPALFCGTPCQTAAMRRKFGDHPLLFLVSVICHGAPSPAVFDQYVDELREKLDGELVSISFRDKALGWQNFSFTAEAEQGTAYSSPHSQDPYMKLFLGNVSLRASCYNCFARGEQNVSDLAIADFWGVANYSEEFKDDTGCSLVQVYTPKGEELWDSVKDRCRFHPVPADGLSKYNPCISGSVNAHDGRERFFSHYSEQSLDQWAAELFPPPSAKQKALRQAKSIARRILR